MENKKKERLWVRIRRKYRLSVLHEETLAESWHVRLSWLGLFSIITLLFLLTLGLFSAVIIYTPIRHILPGYSENIRGQLVEESAKVDSLAQNLALQNAYLDVIKQVLAGEINTDTVVRLDSMQIVMREQLLEAKAAATEEFMREYEAKEKDNMSLFDVQDAIPTCTLFRPVHGVIVRHYSQANDAYDIAIQTQDQENVTAVLAGTIIHQMPDVDNTYTIIIQHAGYVSVYKRIKTVLKHIGDAVQAGESIALVGSEEPMLFGLWQNGQSINPEEVISF